MAQPTRGGAPAQGASVRPGVGASVEVARISRLVLVGDWPASELGYRRVSGATAEEVAGLVLAQNRRAHFARAEGDGIVVLVKG